MRYYVFHQDVKVYPDLYPYTDELLMTTVSYKDNPKGKVIKRSERILDQNIEFGGFSAAKHANGRDWWLIINSRGGNTYYKFLITKDGVNNMGSQDIGQMMIEEIAGRSSKFSHDGRRYARFHIAHGLEVLDFDRLTGEFYNARFIEFWVEDSSNRAYFGNGLEYSPDSRMMYACYGHELVQFDLEAQDIFDSRILIDTFVQDTSENIFQSRFYQMQLAPNGKIYMSHLNSTQVLHTIHDPNKRGTDCSFIMRDVKLKTWSYQTMPYFPNYRLGPDSTVAVTNVMHDRLTMSPNPTTGIIYLSDMAQEILVSDHMGKWIERRRFSDFFDLAQYPSGVYFVHCRLATGHVSIHKIVKID
jgi:hypothetical protein